MLEKKGMRPTSRAPPACTCRHNQQRHSHIHNLRVHTDCIKSDVFQLQTSMHATLPFLGHQSS